MTSHALPPSFLDRYDGTAFSPLYTATVTVTGGDSRHGRVSGEARSSDGALAVSLRLPSEMGGSGGGTNPEQLFAAGFAACFHGALSLLATREGVPIPDASVTASIHFGRDPEDGLFTLAAEVRIALPGIDRDVAKTLVRHTERICPYAKMARQGIECVVRLE
ncbi:Ohr family peroxiredoxin [Luteibacter aegosomatis]|uniref:Ohr family peroxiredoxin n=1 Tax=Luteibacter aegosomatis TaxID=2911537 RepID=UPI0024B62F15|nr:Ohr family peroxiredoxin [Luteibacter aegosomatis]